MHIAIVTTATIPWLTGTSVNPTFRAATLARKGHHVTLYLPWLPNEGDQAEIYGRHFNSKEDHEEEIFSWIKKNTGNVPPGLRIAWYMATWRRAMQSVFPLTPFSEEFATRPDLDLLILEEFEHLYTDAQHLIMNPSFLLGWEARNVISITHTNYFFYACKESRNPLFRLVIWVEIFVGYLLFILRGGVPFRLSRSLPPFYARAIAANGVRDSFLKLGEGRSAGFDSSDKYSELNEIHIDEALENRFYFVGKLVWEKGFADLVRLAVRAGIRTIDVWGQGSHMTGICSLSDKNCGILKFRGEYLDPTELLHYRTFINPSQSEGLTTTTMEALALGQWVILPEHPSNEFFHSFKNALFYEPQSEVSFIAAVRHTEANRPCAL